jgi:hypothetical protein
MKLKITLSFLLGFVVLAMTGCVSTHQVRVDALSSGESSSGRGLTYELASATPGVEESDLFFKEVARYLEPVLAGQAFYPTKKGDAADLLIEVDAHLSEPMTETDSYSEPIYVERGGHYRRIRVPVVNDKGKVVRYSYSSYWSPSRVHVAGWVDQERQVTVYDKVLRLSARRILSPDTYSDELWAVKVTLRNESTDYRAALPYMLVAAGPYIGKHTDGEEVISIKADSEEVQSFRAGILDGGQP